MAESFVKLFIKNIEKILDCKNIDIIYIQGDEMISIVDLDEEIFINNFEGTTFTILNGKVNDRYELYDNYIATFSLFEMPGCCGMALITDLKVFHNYRNKGIGTKTLAFAKKLVRSLEYKVLICTDVDSNTKFKKILKNSKWKKLMGFKSLKTSNRINISATAL